ncbi:hypothetical protein ZWY2020_040116 [Hordeum vulgare]|nr:hypothetical protein ZWY2020_040116 [Hordeum vulgare]
MSRLVLVEQKETVGLLYHILLIAFKTSGAQLNLGLCILCEWHLCLRDSSSPSVDLNLQQSLDGYTWIQFCHNINWPSFIDSDLDDHCVWWLGLSQPSHLPLPDLIKLVIFSNLSIVGMSVSLMWNSVGFYQIAKLCMIPASCLLECECKGMLAAVIAVWSTAFQQYYVHYLQRKYSLNSFNLLAHTAPAKQVPSCHMKTVLVLFLAFSSLARRPEPSCSPWDDPRCSWNDVVWEHQRNQAASVGVSSQ